MSELAARGRLSKTLIVCPKILGKQWKEELETKFDIPAEVATGRALLKADPGEFGAVITTYNSARMYLDNLPEDRFEMLVLDEAHKLRNLYGVPDAPQVAVKFREALEARRFRFVLMLTATPIQNRLWDLYSLVDLLTVARGHQNPFGTEGMFARRFIDDDKTKALGIVRAMSKDEIAELGIGPLDFQDRHAAREYEAAPSTLALERGQSLSGVLDGYGPSEDDGTPKLTIRRPAGSMWVVVPLEVAQQCERRIGTEVVVRRRLDGSYVVEPRRHGMADSRITRRQVIADGRAQRVELEHALRAMASHLDDMQAAVT